MQFSAIFLVPTTTYLRINLSFDSLANSLSDLCRPAPHNKIKRHVRILRISDQVSRYHCTRMESFLKLTVSVSLFANWKKKCDIYGRRKGPCITHGELRPPYRNWHSRDSAYLWWLHWVQLSIWKVIVLLNNVAAHWLRLDQFRSFAYPRLFCLWWHAWAHVFISSSFPAACQLSSSFCSVFKIAVPSAAPPSL